MEKTNAEILLGIERVSKNKVSINILLAPYIMDLLIRSKSKNKDAILSKAISELYFSRSYNDESGCNNIKQFIDIQGAFYTGEDQFRFTLSHTTLLKGDAIRKSWNMEDTKLSLFLIYNVALECYLITRDNI
jgi:hypothetical protein